MLDKPIPKNNRNMDQICNSDFSLQKHQEFIRNYMYSKHKNNPRILLYHGLGSGKTCSSIIVANALKYKMKTLVILPASLKNNYRRELLSQCIKNNPFISTSDRATVNTILKNKQICDLSFENKNLYDTIMKKANSSIDEYFEIISYQNFLKLSNENKLNLNNRLVIIDEVQNVISEKGLMYQCLLKEFVLTKPKNMKLLLLSGTPINDSVHEISLILNLLDDGDNQLPTGNDFIDTFFDISQNSTNIKLKNIKILKSALKNKISYFVGASKNAYPNRIDKYVHCIMSPQQKYVYKKTLGSVADNNPDSVFTYSRTFLISPRQASNVVYSNDTIGLEKRPKNLKASQIISCKFEKAIENILNMSGPSFVYSNFVSASGILDFAIMLKAKGFKEVTSDICPVRSANRFAIFKTGNDKENNRILSIFNSTKNRNGDLIKVILGSPAMKEGVSLLGVRSVHLLEPYWNKSRMEQIIARAIRFCSHKHLPPNERSVTVFNYIATTDDGSMSIDDYIIMLANKKSQIINLIDNLIKKNAFDCNIFKLVNNVKSCEYSKDNLNIPPSDNLLTLSDNLDTIIQKISNNKFKYHLLKRFDAYIYSHSVSASIINNNDKIKNFKQNLRQSILKLSGEYSMDYGKTLLDESVSINYIHINSKYKTYDDICILKPIYTKSKTESASIIRYSKNIKISNLEKLLSKKKFKKSSTSRNKPKSIGGCPMNRVPKNGVCTNPEYPFKRLNNKNKHCCYKTNNMTNIKQFNRSISRDGILLIQNKPCTNYKLFELQDLARSLKLDVKGNKVSICNRIKSVT